MNLKLEIKTTIYNSIGKYSKNNNNKNKYKLSYKIAFETLTDGMLR